MGNIDYWEFAPEGQNIYSRGQRPRSRMANIANPEGVKYHDAYMKCRKKAQESKIFYCRCMMRDQKNGVVLGTRNLALGIV